MNMRTKMRFAHASERANGPTFALADVCFIDFETRSPVDIRQAGAVRYATQADAIILTYAIGQKSVKTISVANFDRPLDMVDLPTELLAFHAKVMNGTGVYAAWNAGFDRAVWNFSTLGFPELKPEHIIDVMAQATASGLPADLAAAAKDGPQAKDKAGRELIKAFCLPGSTATPQTNPEQWHAFLDYAAQDIEALRAVFLQTRQLTLAEWREYWAVEKINDRGAFIDLKLVERAAALAAEDKVRSKAELRAITGDPKMTVDMVARLTAWLLDRLPVEGREILTKRAEEVDEDGNVTRPPKHALTRGRVERLIAYVNDLEMGHLDNTAQKCAESAQKCAEVLRVLQLRLYGGSKTPAKFAKMLASHVDGVLFGQYVFNGASQTGRASSRGVQVHNLARDTLPDEADTIDAIGAGQQYDDIAGRNNGSPVARQLSLLIRPTFIPSGDNVFVWSDWSNIEARVLPWLAGNDPGALARLEIFRAVDANPKIPDLYTRTAAVLSHLPIEAITKPIRQRGKVAELALGFGGGVGSLQAMGAGYGLHVSDGEARATVRLWRDTNPWCVNFWAALSHAVEQCMRLPGVPHRVGRLHYIYRNDYLGGSLFCVLPSGRLLTYRALYAETVDEYDDDGELLGQSRALRFTRGHGRIKLWHGLLCENAVQAVAADVLRGTLVRLERRGARVRLHTHDEVLLECPREEADNVEVGLRDTMREGFDWSEGLPLMSEETVAYYYTKHSGSHGL
jgi:DNA polymerase bacteriophage-type